MSELSYEEVANWLEDKAYADCLIYYGREPTQEEMEDYIEALRDKYL